MRAFLLLAAAFLWLICASFKKLVLRKEMTLAGNASVAVVCGEVNDSA
jgi:hypothetical protein